MIFLKIILFISIYAFSNIAVSATSDDPYLKYEYNQEVIRGQLDNGLSYYILKNAKPANQAELRLVVSIGSLEEQENEKGLAHFLEHLAFNGTKKYPKNTMDSYIQSLGMSMGVHLNAQTGYENTIYKLSVPTDDVKKFETTLQILEEWAHNLVITSEELEKERGVVLEEERGRKGLYQRLYDQTKGVIFNNSLYAHRTPIGEPEVIKTVSVATAKQFYKTWYRPEFMSVIAVGDFDPVKVEAFIKQHFSTIKNQSTQKKASRLIEGVNHSRYQVFTDKEYTNYSFNLALFSDTQVINSKDNLKGNLTRQLAHLIFNERLDEIRKQANPPFIYAYLVENRYSLKMKAVNFALNIDKGNFKVAEERLFQEIARVNQHGFTAKEIERAKLYTLAPLKKAYTERNDVEHPSYVENILNGIQYGNTYLNPQNNYFIRKELLDQITLEEVNHYFRHILDNPNKLFDYKLPEKDKHKALSLEQTEALLKTALTTSETAYSEKSLQLLKQKPQQGKIESVKTYPKLGINEYILSNGLKVLLKKTDFKKHNFQFQAFSEGGSSVESDANYFNSLASASVMQQSGYADYSTDDLRKINAGKIANVQANINPYYESISGNGVQEDMEAVFELIYLAFTQPRLDENIFNNYKRDLHQYIEGKKSQPIQVYNDKLLDFFYDNHLRVRYFRTVEEIESLNMAELKSIYERRFNNAAEFSFIFVGDINQQQFEKYISQYLATLPSQKQAVEHYKNLHINDKQGSHTFLSQKNPENRSNVLLYSSKTTKFTLRKLMLAQAVSHILSVQLNDSVREENSNVYSIGINTNINRVPEEKFTAISSFSCAPEKTTATIELIKKVVAEVKKTGFKQKHLDDYILMVEQEHQKSLNRNQFWLENIEYSLKHQDPLDNILQKPARVKTITLQELQQFVKDYLSFDNYLESIFTTADYQ